MTERHAAAAGERRGRWSPRASADGAGAAAETDFRGQMAASLLCHTNQYNILALFALQRAPAREKRKECQRGGVWSCPVPRTTVAKE